MSLYDAAWAIREAMEVFDEAEDMVALRGLQAVKSAVK